jgi:hypothetical protein
MNGQPNNNAQPINIAIGQILAQTLQNLSQQPGAMEQVGAAGGAAMAEMVSAFARSLAGSSSVMARQLAEQVHHSRAMRCRWGAGGRVLSSAAAYM